MTRIIFFTSLFMILIAVYSCSDLKKIKTICRIENRLFAPSIAKDRAVICGYLLDRQSNKPMEYAYITVPIIKADVKTDDTGFFSFEVPIGKIIIIAKNIGNTSFTKVLHVKSQEKVTLHILLGTTWIYSNE